MIPFLIFLTVLVVLGATLNFSFGWDLHVKFKHLYLKTYRIIKNNLLKAKAKREEGEPARMAMRMEREMKKAKICRQCGAVNKIRFEEKGSTAAGCALLCFFIIPGLVYLIVKGFSRYPVCGSCGAKSLVGGDTPIGKKLLREMKL